jgi:hypothetical protein
VATATAGAGLGNRDGGEGSDDEGLEHFDGY